MLLDYSGRVNVDSLPNEPILVNRNRLGVRSYSQLKRLEISFHMAVTASCWARYRVLGFTLFPKYPLSGLCMSKSSSYVRLLLIGLSPNV